MNKSTMIAMYDDSLGAMATSSKGQSSQALIVQGYSMSVLQQPAVDLSGFEKLEEINFEINQGITTATGNANGYLNVLQPQMIHVITDIDSYINLQNALAEALDTSAPASRAIQLLKAAQIQVVQYQNNASGLVTDLQQFRTALSSDASNFNSYTQKLNSIVGGDNGLLADLQKNLDNINGKINGASAGTVLSGIAIAGGIFMIAVGAISEFVTAGTSTALVVAGVGVLTTGIAGEVASAITLANLQDQKDQLLVKQEQLQSEVRLVTGVSNGLAALSAQSMDAVKATQDMANAWTTLDGHLGNLISNLESGQTSVDDVRHLFQLAGQGSVKDIKSDISVIKKQLAGVNTVVEPTEKVSQLIRREVDKQAA